MTPTRRPTSLTLALPASLLVAERDGPTICSGTGPCPLNLHSGRSGILFQLARHCEVALQIGQCFRRPFLEFRIITTLGVSAE